MAFGAAGGSLIIHLAMRSRPVWQPSAVRGTREKAEQGLLWRGVFTLEPERTERVHTSSGASGADHKR